MLMARNFSLILSISMSGVFMGALVGCAHSKQDFFAHEPTRLLEEDLMQGWEAVDKAPPVVGEYDVTFTDTSNFDDPILQRNMQGPSSLRYDQPLGEGELNPPYRGSLEGNCDYSEDDDGQITVICPNP